MANELENFQDKNQINRKEDDAPRLNLNALAADIPQIPPAVKPRELQDAFELKTGHKVSSEKGTYRIVDSDGNVVKLASGSLEAEGKLRSAKREANGAASARFENGTSVVYDPAGRVTVTGKNGDASSFRVDIAPVATSGTINNMFQNIRR